MANNRKYLSVFRVLFPLLFIFYIGSVTSFTHVHIIDGVKVVHSHPFQNSSKGAPTHSHTWSQIYLIHFIGSYQVTSKIIYLVLFGLFFSFVSLFPFIWNKEKVSEICQAYKLRPPPFLVAL